MHSTGQFSSASVADWSLSPSASSTSCDRPLPDLQSWSDVAFLQWQQLCEEAGIAVSELNYVIQSDCVNSDTKAIVRQALGKSPNFVDWSEIKDGVTWKRDSDQFKAILATPNGRGAAWFLVQHKPQMGSTRSVTEITVRGVEKKVVVEGKTQSHWILVMIEKIESIS